MVFAWFQWSAYSASQQTAREEAEPHAALITRTSAQAVEDLLNEIAHRVDGLAEDLTSRALDDGLEERLAEVRSRALPCALAGPDSSAMEVALCEAAAAIPELNGIGVVFDPQFDPGTQYRPYANRIAGSLVLGELTPRDPWASDWYVAAARGSAAWTHPRFGSTSKTLLVFYSAPFYARDGALRGVVGATYTLDQLADDLRWLSVGESGYSIVLSDRGMLLSHPQANRVVESFSTPPGETGGVVAELMSAVSTARASSVIPVHDDVTDSSAWLIFENVPSVDWTYAAVVVERELLTRTSVQTRQLIGFALATLLAVLMVAAIAFGAHRGRPRALWALSVAAGLLGLIGIAAVWQLTLAGPRELPTTASNERPEAGPATATEEPIFSGIFVQSVEFTGANDVTVSGLAWQQQRSDSGLSEPPGFVLPEADEVSFVEQYRSTTGNLTRIGWAFTASLRQSFDYSRYPLDRETVWLRLWPADYEVQGPLVPDLTSYETLAASTKPGIEKDFVVEGWALDASSFSLRNNHYNTSFGPTGLTSEPRSELYFNVHLKRSFLDALMSQLVPLSVVMILLFGVLLATTEGRIKGENLGFTTLGVLAYCAALFFVVIVSHNELRSELQAQEVIYLEYFYFAAYLAILGVSANAILVGAGRGGRVIEYNDNVIPSLLFWPILNVSLLVITVIAFY